MQAVFLCKSTLIVNHEPVQSIDVRVEDRKFRCWQSYDNKEWDFTVPGYVERNPAICAMIIDGGCLPDYETWELMKGSIRPLLLQVEALVEDQLIWQNIQTLDPFSRC
jgi:hypothetical protein